MTNERLRQSIEQLTKDTAAERIKRREAMDNLIAQDADLIDTAAEWQKGYYAGVEACVWALEADAKLCDCAALEANECACGAWDDYKSITSDRAVEIVRALQEQSK